MAEKKAAAEKREQLYRSTHRLTYLNIVFPQGAVVSASENGWSDKDIKNLVAGGDMVPLSEAEMDDVAEDQVKRQTLYPTQTPLDDVDKVVAKVRGEDVMFVDHRVKGPNEEPPGEREPMITRLPPGDIPSDAPLAVHEAARSMPGGKKVKVAKPQELPPRPEDEAAIVSGATEEPTKK